MIKAQQLDFSLLDLLMDYVKKQDFHSFVPGKMDDAPSRIIFERDMNWLRQSNKIIADVNEPSHGVGMEIMYAYLHDIPVISLLDEKNKPLSRMVEGSPHVLIIEYSSKEDLEESLEEFQLTELSVKSCLNCSNKYEKTVHHKNQCLKC
jgi:nucleoside 2-deoxyribosyltransferase